MPFPAIKSLLVSDPTCILISVTLVNDGTESNEDRLGAVADICLVIQQQKFESEDILIVAGDTLFFPDFSLKDFIEKFNKIQDVSSNSNLIVHCTCPGMCTLQISLV